MGKPQAVQDQIDEANRIQAELSGSKTEDQPKDENLEDKKDPVPAKTEPVDTGNESLEQLKAKLETVESRFKSYKKLYDKEVSGSRADLRKKNDEIEQLKAEIERLKADAETNNNQTEDKEADETLAEISKQFGPEFVDAVSDLSKSQLMRENAKLLSRVDNIEKKLNSNSNEQLSGNEPDDESEDTGYSFESRLKDLVPDWPQINASDQFKEWLNGADNDGNRRQDNLVRAHKEGNVIAVADLFHAFKDAQNSHREKSTGDEEFLPDSLYGGDPETSAEIITEQFISDFYRDKALKKYTPEEAASIEAKINAAMEARAIR